MGPLAPLLALVALLAAAPAATASPAPPATAAETLVRLSDERSFTRWANASGTATIRAQPLASAPAVARLHVLTEEGAAEVYLLEQELTTPAGAIWVQLRIPGRPNGRSGWVPLQALGAIHLTDRALVVSLRRLRATLYLRGRSVWSAPVGVGAAATPTPTGHFWVRDEIAVPGHTLYGPFAFATSDYSSLSEWALGGVVGIHGTNQPGLVPGRPSHGCIRMRNADITYLSSRLPVGAPVDVID